MNCFDIQDMIIDLLLGELSPADKMLVQEHLEHCPLCRQEFQFLHNCLHVCTLEETETCECQFQASYWDEFVVSIHEKITHEKKETTFPFRIVIPIAASAVAAMALGYYFFLRPKPEETVQETLPGYQVDPYEEVYELSPEETEEFLKMVDQRYGP
jgi:hypothetical protein